MAANVASVIEDGSCMPFSVGSFYEALCLHLRHKRELGVHSPFFTDALMDLVQSGAVTNRSKSIFRLGIASFMLKLLKEAARRCSIQGFTADVLPSNQAMIKVFEKAGPVQASVESGRYNLAVSFETESSSVEQPTGK